MKLQYVKAKKILIVDPFDGIQEQETPSLAFDFRHNLTQDEDRYVCTTEVKVCSVLKSKTVTDDLWTQFLSPCF